MKHLITMTAVLISSAAVLAAGHPCQKPVEKQNKELAAESSAQLEDKLKTIEAVKEATDMFSKKEQDQLIKLLNQPNTVVFSFGNDAGTWIAIANAQSCKVITTNKIQDI